MKRIASLILILWLVLPSPGRAQTRASASKAPPLAGYKLVSVKATGTLRYTDKEILAATGLQAGQNAADGDFKEAARRLGNSGLFSDVVYSFSYSNTGVKLELQLTDIDQSKLVPAKFENFVWFTDAELLNSLQQRVPLFKQLMPLTGRLPDEVSEALQALLNEKHLPGRVYFLPEGSQEGGDLKGVVYHVAEVSLRIRDLEFPGASPEQSAFLTKAAHRLPGTEYSRGSLAAAAKYDLLPQYLQRGYLKAAFALSDARVVTHPAPQADARPQGDLEVDAIVPVTPGEQYAVSDVTWNGNSAVSTAEASSLFHLRPGEPADAVRLVQDAESLGKLYHSRGYMTAKFNPDARIDDEKATVHYDMSIAEGDLYNMGELEIVGVDTPSKDRLREAWALREGQPYNADYCRKFQDEFPRLLPRGLQYEVTVNVELDAKSKTVDVTIHFKML